LIEFKKYTKDSASTFKSEIIRKLEFSSLQKQKDREYNFITSLSNLLKNSQTIVYILKYNDNVIGLIALSTNSMGNGYPCLQIDYIFINASYRAKVLPYLDDEKPSRYLIEFATKIALDIKKLAGLKYLALKPDNDKLHHFYTKNLGFHELKKTEWLFVKL
jgi:hypothetical protein